MNLALTFALVVLFVGWCCKPRKKKYNLMEFRAELIRRKIGTR